VLTLAVVYLSGKLEPGITNYFNVWIQIALSIALFLLNSDPLVFGIRKRVREEESKETEGW
jgi:hypothetical protein